MRARLYRIPPGVCATVLLLAGLAAVISALFWWPPSWPELWLVMIGLVVPPLWAGWLLLRRRRWIPALLGVALLGFGALGIAGILTGAYHYVRLGGVWASLESRERHAVLDSRSIALTYVTLPARTAQPADPNVYLAGGPGGSAILTRLLTPRDVLFTALRDVADVVLFEQRGAMPWGDPSLACPETWSYPLDTPFEPSAGLQARSESLRRCVREHESNAIDISAYNTRESVGDLEILRRRLGAPRLTLWATSYGTHLALAYLRQFPDRVGALVLHGVEGPDHTLKRPTVVDAGLADLTRRFSSGDEPPRDFVNEVATLIDELRDTPRTVPVDGVEVTTGPFDLQLFVTAQMGTAASRARLVAALGTLAAMAAWSLPARNLAWLALVPVLWWEPARPGQGGAVVEVLDVGHGLAVLVQTRSHTLLYDAGAVYRSGFDTGREIVVPAMRAKSWETLDKVVVSHADNDHAGGIPAVLESFPDAQVLMGSDVELAGGDICQTGQAWTWDEVRFEILHPDPAFHRRGNDSSCVLKVVTSAGSLLLTGDVEVAGERALMADPESLAADIVVVPHHGSATSSSTALVRESAPGHAVVSAGYLNHWGFPKPAVVERWERIGAEVVTTGEAGAVEVILEPGQPVRVEGLRSRQRRYWNADP